jgi:hypothetical protein
VLFSFSKHKCINRRWVGECNMARARDPNRDKAYNLWKEHNGEITNREIANQLDIDEKKGGCMEVS